MDRWRERWTISAIDGQEDLFEREAWQSILAHIEAHMMYPRVRGGQGGNGHAQDSEVGGRHEIIAWCLTVDEEEDKQIV